MPIPQSLIEKIKALPAECIVEVEDFVDFIAARARAQPPKRKIAVALQILQRGHQIAAE
jgi:hypothetical protein